MKLVDGGIILDVDEKRPVELFKEMAVATEKYLRQEINKALLEKIDAALNQVFEKNNIPWVCESLVRVPGERAIEIYLKEKGPEKSKP